MIKLPLIPEPYPNEIFGSWLARTRDLHQSGAWNQLKSVCGFSPSWLGCFDIPDLSEQYEKLLEVMGVNFAWVLQNHTTFPYFAALGSGDNFIHGTSLFQIHGTKALSKLGISRIPNASSTPRYCPVCISSDIARYGEPFWHREHQLPNVYYCVAHRHPLRATCRICHEVVAGVDFNRKLNGKCANGHSLQSILEASDIDEPLFSLSDLSVSALCGIDLAYKKIDVISLIERLRVETKPESGSQKISTIVSKFYNAHLSNRHTSYLEVPNPPHIDYPAFFLINTNKTKASVPWLYAVLTALNANWTLINKHFDTRGSTLPKPSARRRFEIVEFTIESAKDVIQAYSCMHDKKNVPVKAYWFLALYDRNWLVTRFGRIQPTPDVFDDRQAILKNFCTALLSGSTRYGESKGPFVRAGFRDKKWRDEILFQFQIATRPSEFENSNTIFDDRAKLVLTAVKEFVASPGPPRKVDARQIAQKVGLSHETVSAIVKRTPEILSIFQSSRENFSTLRIIWALRKILELDLRVSAKTISEVLSENYAVAHSIYRDIQKILLSDSASPKG
jgi:hypothetical protein